MSEINNEAPITVGYWSIRGLAAPLRMMVMFSGRKLNNVMYDGKTHSDSIYLYIILFTF